MGVVTCPKCYAKGLLPPSQVNCCWYSCRRTGSCNINSSGANVAGLLGHLSR